MFNDDTHHLLAQVALTVSPHVSLPSATTLPYTYKTIPSSLPPSSTTDRSGSADTGRPAFVVSSSGQAAHPTNIQESCRKLEKHLKLQRQEADEKFKEWEEQIKERELAEKRRVAPGWLDREEKILQPQRGTSGPLQDQAIDQQKATFDAQIMKPTPGMLNAKDEAEGEELDRAFGSLDMR